MEDYYLDTASSSRLFNYIPKNNYNPNSQYENPNSVNILQRLILERLVEKPDEYNILTYSSCTQANQDLKNLGVCKCQDYSHPSLPNNALDEYDIISIEHVVSELGFIENLDKWYLCANQNNKLLHIDITSALMLGIKYKAPILTFSTYKMGIPIGLGFMIIHKSLPLNKLHYNNGTFPLLLTDWFVHSWLDAIQHYEDTFSRAKYVKEVLDTIANPVTKHNSPFIMSYVFDVNVDILYPQLLKRRVLCSRGASCRKGEFSRAYKIFGVNPKSVIRFSVNHLTTDHDIEGIDIVKDLYYKMKA